MYNNIDTEHTVTVITWWIKDLGSKGQLPEGFPSYVIISAVRIIMTNNIFEFGDMFFYNSSELQWEPQLRSCGLHYTTPTTKSTHYYLATDTIFCTLFDTLTTSFETGQAI